MRRLSAFLARERSVAPEGFRRWRAVPGSILVQLSIGSVYAWSIFNTPLTTSLGVVASSHQDWSLSSTIPIFSACALSLGISTFTLGAWAEREGPRKVAAASAAAWSSGLALTAAAVHLHFLPLAYLGYGLLGGLGWGLGYISPVSTMLKWFQDRRGLASGLALTAFGGGAILATPVNEALLSFYFEAPEFLGALADVELESREGIRYAAEDGREVVVATAADVARLPVDHLDPGVYVVGTGNSGASKTFLTLACLHGTTMMSGALMMRVPRDGWQPEGFTPAPNETHLNSGLDASDALRTHQFGLLWLAVFGNASAGVALISCAKTLMSDMSPALAAGYVASLSASNMAGRLGFATLSDKIGPKRVYALFGAAAPLAFALPVLSSTSIPAFYASTCAITAAYGGLFSALPPYIAQTFGPKHVGSIHGRLLTAWSGAAIAGPAILSFLRQRSLRDTLEKLAAKAEADAFLQAFGAPVSELPSLIESKVVNIPALLEILPGVADPTPSLYESTFQAMAGILCIAAISNSAIRKIK